MKLTKLKLVPGINADELEMFFDTEDYPFGVNATVRFKQNSVYEGHVGVYHNLTEVHWLYNTELSKKWPDIEELGVALESDIHGTGGTRKLVSIDSIEIVPATKKHKNW